MTHFYKLQNQYAITAFIGQNIRAYLFLFCFFCAETNKLLKDTAIYIENLGERFESDWLEFFWQARNLKNQMENCWQIPELNFCWKNNFLKIFKKLFWKIAMIILYYNTPV